ncbi:MAG TPA: sigma-70 family RNA polymerase sigma factor [Marmoricola sp.]|nr:sigma-70 family RNA polymerase sigma factor [Marmoricola sp.]
MLAFEEIVATHGPMVLRVCRAALGPVDAEDAWSETFLAALRAYPTADVENVEAWLVTIAHRRAIDVRRRRARDALPVATLPERPTAPYDAHAHDELYAALAALPAKQRLTVAYHHLGGLPHREVAALLGGTEEAARRAAADGVRALRARLLTPTGATS